MMISIVTKTKRGSSKSDHEAIVNAEKGLLICSWISSRFPETKIISVRAFLVCAYVCASLIV